jgi:hypothetical protein
MKVRMVGKVGYQMREAGYFMARQGVAPEASHCRVAVPYVESRSEESSCGVESGLSPFDEGKEEGLFRLGLNCHTSTQNIAPVEQTQRHKEADRKHPRRTLPQKIC